MCQTAASTSPVITTRRENLWAGKISRIAKRYAIPASVKNAMKRGAPRSAKLREQPVSATRMMAPKIYTFHSGATFTILLCPYDGPFDDCPVGASTAGRLREKPLD